MAASPLALRIADEIKEWIRGGRIPVGEHLSTQKLADQFGVSRSPVREALQVLAERGVLEQHANRGFFAKHLPQATPGALVDELAEFPDGSDDYQRLADDWIADRVPAEVTEQFLRERYRLTKSQLTDLLMRAVREGWLERKPGYGWRFLPVAKTPEAFEQIYRFRMLIEPAAMLEPTFRLDRRILAEQRAIQEGMLSSDIATQPAERLLHNGSLFHEELIRMSGNPFFHQALVRVNRMRRLLEYRAQLDRSRLRAQCTEHLEIVVLLEQGEVFEASYLMRRHLGGALARKSPVILPGNGAEPAAAE
ncbi:GntR family transcriptional regulator [Ancylobacter amanitiformis]|uniref:DNA-binding GntR family transcriptional regulator n=1 Tax=Ancylobacter amanitiformis TaxID=217069 RepID=A0ABU0LWF5_9HYPH|nr:GntR family transcriptional regulator [Ancylobacter amanitiformis]MDQ0512940.1 DNA-binding GntR family transcriptional regulator [Ancylobacter amanitiformis]